MLDVIIPSYKDMEGLYRTLKSVYYPQYKDWITITVIDDCSNMDYSEVMADYPSVQFHLLKENHGPGYARQYGIDHTKEPFIFFVDCGDVVVSKYSFLEIKDTIEEHPEYILYLWSWIMESGKLSGKLTRSTQGWVYSREFLDAYNIRFNDDPIGGRADEDVGFNHICSTIIKYLELRDDKQHSHYSAVPIYRKVHDDNSITSTNNYSVTRHVPGLVSNSIYCMKHLEKYNIDKDTFIEEMNILMFSLYRDFLRCAKKDTSVLQNHWTLIRNYYNEVYQKYEHMPENEIYILQNMGWYIKELQKITSTPNIRRFLKELKDEEECPQHYYTLR